MLRVLMVLDDYGELMFLQTVLKKIGFDVDAIQNPQKFQDSLLGMNPDVLVMTAQGKRVKGLELSRTVRRARGLPHIVLIRGTSLTKEEDLNVDAWLDSPVAALSLLNTIADLCGLNKEVLADKFVRLRLQEPAPDEARVLRVGDDSNATDDMVSSKQDPGNFGKLGGSSLSEDERKSRYSKFLKQEIPVQEGFSVKQVQEQVKALRREENPDDLAELERQRKAFVEHLFKKKN